MAATHEPMDFQLQNLDRSAWMDRIEEVCDDYGHCEPLGPNYTALQIDRGSSLIVCFETVPSVRKHNPEEAPLGWLLSRDLGWSSLTFIASESESWFRHPAVFGFFDRLIDDGYFDEFDQILFYGAGGCGYAACAFSVAAPDCNVLALRPQTTLDPALARWDRRHIEARKLDFTSRFGYAPMMLETAAKAWIVNDPIVTEDEMHASLFKAENTELLRTPYLGPMIERDFASMDILNDIIQEAMEGTLDQDAFAGYWRARRDHMPYLRSLFHRIDASERDGLMEHLCRFVSHHGNRPMFAKRLAQIEAERAEAQPAPETEDA